MKPIRKTALAACVALALSAGVVGPAAARSAHPEQPPLVKPVVYLTSPWFPGVHFVGINYGCNGTGYYPHDSRCPGSQGFHHGIDISMPYGTPVISAVRGTVIRGGLGSAYGYKAFIVRTKHYDILLGHVSKVLVRSGQRVAPGQVIAKSGDLGAPDGSHLHFEVRQIGQGYTSALNPMRQLHATIQ